MTTTIYTPFTYLIGWSQLDRWYYGVRYARGCSPDDLWTKYFTSSGVVKKMREEHGEPDVVQVRQTFPTDTLALAWEEKVLRRLNAVRDERWLNKQNAGREFNNTSEETRRKISESKKGQPRTTSFRRNTKEDVGIA